mmetsp:Transcript_15647/g.33445  ORF Transcript_15647/g.33445 Transcript_15647/m.33445 type:complete len:251 (-) Transcript_15647:521-1273(-)
MYNRLSGFMLCSGKADPARIPVEDAVVLAEEWVTQNPQARDTGRDALNAKLALVCTVVICTPQHVEVGLQAEVLARQGEGQRGEGLHIGAVACKVADRLVDLHELQRRHCNHRGASVNDHWAADDGSTAGKRFSLHCEVVCLHEPVAQQLLVESVWHPRDLPTEERLVVATQRQLGAVTALGSAVAARGPARGQEEGEHPLLDQLVLHHHIEGREHRVVGICWHGNLRIGKAKDSIERALHPDLPRLQYD